jgi:hypothetical protein
MYTVVSSNSFGRDDNCAMKGSWERWRYSSLLRRSDGLRRRMVLRTSELELKVEFRAYGSALGEKPLRIIVRKRDAGKGGFEKLGV